MLVSMIEEIRARSYKTNVNQTPVEALVAFCRSVLGLSVKTVHRAEEIPSEEDTSSPTLSVLDIGLADTAFDVAEVLRRGDGSASRIVFMGDNITDVCLDQALKLEAVGILSITESLDNLAADLQRILLGETRFSPVIAQRLAFDASSLKYRLKTQTLVSSLTARQLEVLRFLARGDSVKEVGRKLYLSHKTIDNYKYRIMKTIGVNDRVRLTRFAIREGLIQP
ncbi:helix-turn-helix transcriptional regulator [Lignipirellula cremea]|uniref:Response regulator UvrY n=1 Tax=Lignipirellula cremea TaxID=2528010 RepID=A0A518DU47_9BACT|nr:response regulator transcription factor [Lignipirellula cremea]QDU95348.1 Response regulator UvrY [Lignipirellula cremea]